MLKMEGERMQERERKKEARRRFTEARGWLTEIADQLGEPQLCARIEEL